MHKIVSADYTQNRMHTTTSSLFNDFRSMARHLATAFDIPDICEIFLPPLYKGGQPHDSEFMAIRLKDNSVGISYVLLAEECRHEYEKLRSQPLSASSPLTLAACFGNPDPVKPSLDLSNVI